MPNEFLNQFMAGWQMGQGRRESQRRDQELQMEQARQQQAQEQRAAQFQLQQEEFALRKKQLAAEEHAHKLQMAKEAFQQRMEANQLSNLPPPTAADVGIPEQSPDMAGPMASEIQVPQPTMAMPSPMQGQPDVQMPVLTGRQQQEMAQAAEQAKMRAAIGMKVAEAQALQPFKDADFNREAGLKRELANQRTKQMQAVLGSFGSAKTEGQQNKVEIAQYAVSKMPGWQAFIRDNKDKFGFYAGQMTKASQSGALRPLGIKPDAKTAKFSSELATVSSAMLNALSGAAISPAEFERLKQSIPQITDDPDVIPQKMATMDDYFKFRLKNFNAPYQGPGWQNEPSPPAALAGPTGGTPAAKALGTWYGIEILSGGE